MDAYEQINVYCSPEWMEQHEEIADRMRKLAADVSGKLVSEFDEDKLTLRLTEEGLELTRNGLSMRGDFAQMIPRLRHNNLSGELLVKAAKIKNLSQYKKEGEPAIALDATAGMGEDSLLLAASGYEVYLYEYNPVIAALLSDTLRRARVDEHKELSEAAGRMHLICGDSVEAMRRLGNRVSEMGESDVPKPDFILLDPMFPERQKSGLIKKKFQLLQQLEAPCTNEEDLLNAALMASPLRIAIKRPQKGPFLGGRKPDYSLQGKAIRYDCIVLPR